METKRKRVRLRFLHKIYCVETGKIQRLPKPQKGNYWVKMTDKVTGDDLCYYIQRPDGRDYYS